MNTNMDRELSLESLNQAENVNLDVGNGCFLFRRCSDCEHFDPKREYCGRLNIFTKSEGWCHTYDERD